MTQSSIHSLVLPILQQVSFDRLQRAVGSLADGSLATSLTQQSASEIRAVVTNGNKIEYSVVITPQRVFCSCKDSMRRHTVCKHATALALQIVRTPQAQLVQSERYQLGDRVYQVGHPSWTGKVICVSGDTISVAWDSGGIRPLLVWQLERCEERAPNLSLGKVRKGFAFPA